MKHNRKPYTWVLTAIAVYVTLPSALAASPLVLSSGAIRYTTLDFVEILEDSEGGYPIEAVAGERVEHQFVPLRQFPALKDFTAYWLRLRLASTHAEEVTYGWEVREDEFTSYQRKGDRYVVTAKGGALVPHAERQPNELSSLALVTLSPGEETTLYVRVLHKWGHRIPPTDPTYGALFHYPAFQRSDTLERHLLGIYYGLTIVLGLVSLMMFGVFRRSVYGWYSLFSGFLGLYSYSLSGYAFQFLWPWFPRFNKISAILIAPLLMGAFILFSSEFLKLKTLAPRFRKFLLTLSAIFFGTIPLFLGEYRTGAYVLQFSVASSAFLIVYALGIRAIVRGHRAAWIYLAGNSLLIGAVILQFSVTLSWVPYTQVFRYALQLGSASQLVMVMIALFYDMMRIRAEQEQAAARELELQKKTLESTNRLLTSFSRFMPTDFLNCLGESDITRVKLGDARERKMAVLFSDIRSFTSISETLSARENFSFLNAYLGRVGPIIRRHGGYIDKFIGDAVMALFPDGRDGALGAIAAAEEMLRTSRLFRFRCSDGRVLEVNVGIGIHYGTLVLGTIGEEMRMDGTVISDVVNVASRIEQLTKVMGCPLIASQDLIGQLGDLSCVAARRIGRTRLKGRSARLTVYEIFVADSEEIKEAKLRHRAEFEHAISLFEQRKMHQATEVLQRLAAELPEDRAIRYLLSKTDWTGLIQVARNAS